ncbi:MAG: hypothetical protein DRP51_05815 [Candidatus Zixiibacteriota bacterium]|nr:MAG: hypothetical protein DRP51_05815 [candidate division Zixibacteria bacterium]
MKKNKIVTIQTRAREIQKSILYINNIDLFLNEIDSAVPLLIKVLKVADTDLKDEIIFLLGGIARKKVIWLLYEIMVDTGENKNTRHSAAIQISVTAAFIKDTNDLTEKLLADIKSSDPLLRCLAAFAVGWERNDKAAIPLLDLMQDDDLDIQQIAANALVNLKGSSLLKFK